ncbi:hypothetical protein Bbelb_317230 [Branchiostoma belcheri]|nr:hypothetical protein Bbelb_317230 [Branchiostoma belcheri]
MELTESQSMNMTLICDKQIHLLGDSQLHSLQTPFSNLLTTKRVQDRDLCPCTSVWPKPWSSVVISIAASSIYNTGGSVQRFRALNPRHTDNAARLASFYRKFVPAFATVAEPLVRLTDKHHNFQWNPACQSAFDTLKHQLTSPPILAFPDFTREFTLATDASNTGIGAVLTQEHGTTRRVVAYASKTLSRSQRRWSTYDQEFWAAVWAVRHFRPYLYGHNFTLLTDHRPLLSCREVPLGDGMAQGRRTRWAIELSTYQFTIKYRPGPTNTDADALSRRPPSPPPDNVDAALDTPDSAEVVVRDTAEPAEVISADDSTEPKLLHDVVRDDRDSANVVSANDQPAPPAEVISADDSTEPKLLHDVVRDDRDSANVVSANDQPAPPAEVISADDLTEPKLLHDVVRDDRDSANVVSANDQPAPPAEVISADDSTEPKLLHDVVRDDRDSANVVSANDQPAPPAEVISADDSQLSLNCYMTSYATTVTLLTSSPLMTNPLHPLKSSLLMILN